MFIAKDPGKHATGKPIDNGHCVRFCQVACPGLPQTSHWRPGRKVRGGNVPPGTVIATFVGDRYSNLTTDGSAHAAILVAEQSDGLAVLDQWVGSGGVKQRTLRYRGGAGAAVNDGDAFHVVEV